MSKHVFSLVSCASAIEVLSDIANSTRMKPRAAELELLTEQARQIINMLRDPLERTAIVGALSEVRRNRT